ncbi:sterol homeostasis protein ARV1 [Sporobolomyces salmoneus]|uniref:sterol homeostasis protein ARV1 n=1 Tax=Sporobolomyces salmoneus TaxID=183962 RepID=UPI00317B273D
MKPNTRPAQSESGYECINCSSPVDSLYISYAQQSNTSLLECPRCGQLADDFLSFPFSISLLNLLLLKPSVYRHLLRNRGGETAKERRRFQGRETGKLALISIGVDTIVRCIPSQTENDLETIELFVKTFGYCTLGSLSFLLLPFRHNRCGSSAAATKSSERYRVSLSSAPLDLHESNPSACSLFLLPLALLYSSIPTTFFLIVSSIIWRNEYLPSPSLSSSPTALLDLSSYVDALTSTSDEFTLASPWANYIISFSRANLKSRFAQIGSGSARGWASEAVLRKGVGGSSAIVAVSVVLRISKIRAVAVLATAWGVHLVLLHALDGWIA